MTDEEFVDICYKNTVLYFLQKYKTDKVDDRSFLWKKIFDNYVDELSIEDETEFWNLVREIQFDCLTGIFDLIDNQAYPSQQTKDFTFMHGDVQLNRELCNILWANEQSQKYDSAE